MAETALRSILARFGVRFDDKELKEGTRSVGNAIGKLRDLGGVIGGSAIVGGLTALISQVASANRELSTQASRLQISTQALQGWQFAAQAAGAEAEDITEALSELRVKAYEAVIEGSDDTREHFERLGVQLEDDQGRVRDTNALMLDFVRGLSETTDATVQLGAADALMSEEGKRLLPFFRQGTEAVQALLNEYEELGGAASPELIRQSEEASQQFLRLNASLGGLRNRLAVTVLPIVNRAIRTVTRWSVTIRELTENSNLWQIALAALGIAAVALGIKLTLAFAGPLITIGLLAAALLIIALIIDDLWVAIKGGDSIIGSMVDEVLAAIGVWWRFYNMVQEVRQAVQDLWEVLQAGGQFVAGLFGAQAPETVSAGFIRGGHEAGRGVREVFAPGERRARLESEAQEAALRRRSRRIRAARAREGGPLEGDIRAGRAIMGDGGRITGRAPAQRFQGGQWVAVGDTTVDVTVTTAATDPEEVGRIARRETTRALEQERRATLAALEGARGEAS